MRTPAVDPVGDSDRNPQVICLNLAAAAAAAAGPQQAWLWQPTLSRRNVHPHLQISFDSCKLSEGWQEGGSAAIFILHSARAKAEREKESCLLFPALSRRQPRRQEPLWPAGETSGGLKRPEETAVRSEQETQTSVGQDDQHGSAVLQQRLRPQVWHWQEQGWWVSVGVSLYPGSL